MPHHDLLIIGAGSGNTIIGPEHDHLDIAIAEPAEFGGTCMNRGCIPSKMLIYVADVLTEGFVEKIKTDIQEIKGIAYCVGSIDCLLYTSDAADE